MSDNGRRNTKSQKREIGADKVCDKMKTIFRKVTPRKKASLARKGILSPQTALKNRMDTEIVKSIVREREKLKFKRDKDSTVRRNILCDALVTPVVQLVQNPKDELKTDPLTKENKLKESIAAEVIQTPKDELKLDCLTEECVLKDAAAAQSILTPKDELKLDSGTEASTLKGPAGIKIHESCTATASVISDYSLHDDFSFDCMDSPQVADQETQHVIDQILEHLNVDQPETEKPVLVLLDDNFFQQQQPMVSNQHMLKDDRLEEYLHPAIRRNYVPIKTSPDGNCLWNMASICLTGDENAMDQLRKQSTQIMHSNMDHFNLLLDKFNCDPRVDIESLLDDACMEGNWGGEFHIYALSMLLRRPIYIYCSQLDRHGKFSDMHDTDDEISLKLSKRNTKWRGHLKYEAVNVIGAGRKPICGVFRHQHYTALLPRSNDSHVFMPCSNLLDVEKVMDVVSVVAEAECGQVLASKPAEEPCRVAVSKAKEDPCPVAACQEDVESK